jgi:hypothetical protein
MKLNQKIIYSGYTTNDSPANDRHYSLISTRRLVEKIMGQFSGRFSIEKIRQAIFSISSIEWLRKDSLIR